MSSIPYLEWLSSECNYTDVREISGGRWVALQRLMYTTAIIMGAMGDVTSYQDRWCYRDRESALSALNAWDGSGEPLGWHRHPATGRRVSETGEQYVYY